MRKVERRLRERIKDLEYEISELKRERNDLLDDRAKFRSHFIIRFKWWIELLGKVTRPDVAWLVENDAKWLQTFKKWDWQ